MKNARIHIALVDDQRMFRDGLKALLNALENMEVVLECENGRTFLEQCSDAIDIVLLDVEMPEFNGLETMEELHRMRSSIKVIFVSVNKEALLISRMMELGARGYLTKDTTAEELETAILSVHQTGFYFNDLVSQSLLIKLAGKEHVNPTFNYVEHLSEREKEVLQLICQERTTKEIADQLFLSPKTVENHRSRIMDKTGVRNTAGLVIFAIKHHLVDVG